MQDPVLVGVDIGGTFTDLVLLQNGQLRTAKVLSTGAPADGVFTALGQVGISGGPGSLPPDGFSHGMTVATNALLERQGAPTLLLTTVGFRDLLHIGRQNRPSLYDLTQPKPDPVIPRVWCLGVQERCSRDGVITPLTKTEVDRILRTVAPIITTEGIQSIAVGFLFAFLYPQHERQLGAALRQAFPTIHVSLSSEVAPEFREYERLSTTALDAYLSPPLSRYLTQLAAGCHSRGIPEPVIMQSSGGVTTLADAAAHASKVLLSGPAGGVYGAAYVGSLSGYHNLLTFDMGGTSTDVALVQNGSPQLTPQAVVCGYPVLQPQIDIHTVSAGGGSIAAVVAGGGIQVGPRSAGSTPGPACYGLGGVAPTVTDANVWLGYLPDGGVLGGSVRLSRQRAAEAIQSIATPLGLSIQDMALGIRTLANTHMARALRVISVERGLVPASFALMAFGGAGPMHACALADMMDMRTVLFPRACGVLSAFGMALSDLRRDYRQAVLKPLGDFNRAQYLELLRQQAHHDLNEPILAASLDLRYRGQSFELTIPIEWHETSTAIQARFHQIHHQRYGWQDPSQPIEVVHSRLSARQVRPRVTLTAPIQQKDPIIGHRNVWVMEQFQRVPIYRHEWMGTGDTFKGPAIIEMAEATAVVDPGWQVEMDAIGTLVLRQEP